MHLWNAELSLCRESERGHTHSSNALHPAAASHCFCFKGTLHASTHTHTHTHPALLAASVRLPTPVGARLCVCRCWLWFAVLCAAPAVVPGHCRFGGVEMGVCWEVGVGGADSPSSRHSTSFVIFISHVFLFFCSLLHQNSPRPSSPKNVSNGGLTLKLVTWASLTQDCCDVETSCNPCSILQTLCSTTHVHRVTTRGNKSKDFRNDYLMLSGLDF